jgi:putative ABC transport system permease protein
MRFSARRCRKHALAGSTMMSAHTADVAGARARGGSLRAALSFRAALRQLRATGARLLLSVLAIALGVALVVAVRSMNESVLSAFVASADEVTGRAALTVHAGEDVTFSDTVGDSLARVPGVRLAVPLVRSAAFATDGSGEMLTVHGVDLANEAAVRVYDRAGAGGAVIADPLEFLNQMDSILLGQQFAEERGLRVGDALELGTPNGSARFVVRGLLEPRGLARALDGRLVVMDLYAAERSFTADGQVNQIDLLLQDGADANAVRMAVADVLPRGLRVEEPSVRRVVLAHTVQAFQGLLTAFSLLAIVVGFVICFSRLSSIFRLRTFHIGLLRAVGLRRRVVFLELLKESVLIGGAGSLVGIGLGIAITHYALPLISRSTAIALRLPTPSPTARVGGDAIALGAAMGLLAAALAALLPAWRLAHSEPVSALTMRGREPPPVLTCAARRLRFVMLLVALAGLGAVQALTRASAVGNVITGVIALLICVLATPLLSVGISACRPLLEHGGGADGRLAAHSILSQPGRSALTVATLGLGLGTVLMFGTLAWSFEQTLVGILTRSLRADLIVSSAFVSGGYWSAPLRDDLVAAAASVDGVALAAGEQSKEVAFRGESVFLKTYDPVAFRDRRIYEWPLRQDALPDALERVASGQAALATAAFAYRYQTRPGDTVAVESPTGEVRLAIAGVSNVPIENAIVLSRDRYRALWNDPMVSLIHVVAADGRDRVALGADLRRRLGIANRLQVRSGGQLIRYFAEQVRQAFSLLYLVEAVIFGLILIAMGDNLAAGVIERTREFGMMRATGVRRARVARSVILEGAVIGGLGILLAAIGGLALGHFWVQVQFPAILGWRLEMHFPYRFALVTSGLALALCLLGSFLPARRAARTLPAAALRCE